MKTVLGVSSEFDYFKSNVVEADIEDNSIGVIDPKNALVHGQPIDFIIPAADHIYRDLNRTKLRVLCKVTKADGSDLADTDAVAPVNLFLHSLFSEIEITLNGEKITDTSSYYAERSYLETLLTRTADVNSMRGVAEGWCKDNGSLMKSFLLKDTNDAKANAGFVKRSQWIKASRVVELVGRLHGDIFNQDLDIPSGVEITIKLTPAPDKKVLLAETPGFKVVILDARLLMANKKVSSELELSHNQMLETNYIRVPFTRVQVKQLGHGKNDLSFKANDFYSGPKPSRVTIVIAKSTALSGTINENPYCFEPHDMRNIHLSVNSMTKVPNHTIDMNFTDGRYYTAYMNTLESLDLDQGRNAIDLTPEDWASGYNVHVFKLVPVPVTANYLHSSNYENVSLTLDVNFNTVLSPAYVFLALIESPGNLIFDENKSVISH